MLEFVLDRAVSYAAAHSEICGFFIRFRGNRAAQIEDVFARTAGVQDRAAEVQHAAAGRAVVVDAPPPIRIVRDLLFIKNARDSKPQLDYVAKSSGWTIKSPL